MKRTIIYVVSAILLVGLIGVALAVHRQNKADRAADEKADQLIASLQQDGYTAPSKDQIVRVLGSDGGMVCTDPGRALGRAILLDKLSNGSGGPGERPVIADRRSVRGGLRIVQIYCPEKIDAVKSYVDDLKLSGGDTA
jgi:hypothetical protein